MEDTTQQHISMQSAPDTTSTAGTTNIEESKAEEPSAARVRVKKGEYRPRSAPHPSTRIFVSAIVSQHPLLIPILFQPFAPEAPNPLDERAKAIEQELFEGKNTFLPGPSGTIKLQLHPH